jgi:CheY-like chemotaxis protein
VLIVDDDADVRDLAVTCLEALGYRVLAAPNGRAGLEILGHEQQVHLLLLDFAMPGMNGLEVARAMRERFGEGTLPDPIHGPFVGARNPFGPVSFP